MTPSKPVGKKKPSYKIFWYEGDYVATSTEFKNVSACASTPLQALRELFMVIASVRKSL